MNIEEQRKAFDDWHFLDWKLNNAEADTVEFAKALYDRVYMHDHTSCVREIEFKAWLASANREGYKLVPLEPTERMLDSAYSSISDNLHYADLENIYTAMIGACDD